MNTIKPTKSKQALWAFGIRNATARTIKPNISPQSGSFVTPNFWNLFVGPPVVSADSSGKCGSVSVG